jgi:lipid II:glycine glycyltransferase (peptidoglycan interpeptide bridge formation enzyme)
MIAQDLGFVMLVSHQGRNIAGAIFFTFASQAMYKFGASDIKYQHLYPNYLLFWCVLQWLCENGYKELCFGRTSQSQEGLIQFKNGWGTRKSHTNYYRYDIKTPSFTQNADRRAKTSYNIYKKMPMPLLKLAGSVLYKHLG